jgi:hypothetical protein
VTDYGKPELRVRWPSSVAREPDNLPATREHPFVAAAEVLRSSTPERSLEIRHAGSRIGDAQREEARVQLVRAHAAGIIPDHVYDARMAAVDGAEVQDRLSRLTEDFGHQVAPVAPERSVRVLRRVAARFAAAVVGSCVWVISGGLLASMVSGAAGSALTGFVIISGLGAASLSAAAAGSWYVSLTAGERSRLAQLGPQ